MLQRICLPSLDLLLKVVTYQNTNISNEASEACGLMLDPGSGDQGALGCAAFAWCSGCSSNAASSNTAARLSWLCEHEYPGFSYLLLKCLDI